MKKTFSIKTIWYGIVALITLLPMLILIPWIGIKFHSILLESTLQKEALLNEHIKNHLQHELTRIISTMEKASEHITDMLKQELDENIIMELLESVLSSEKAIHAIYIIKADGELFAGIKDPSFYDSSKVGTLIRYNGNTFFNPGFDSNSPEIAIPLHGRTYIGSSESHKEKLDFYIALPVVGSSEYLPAVLLADIGTEMLWQQIAPKLVRHGVTYVVDNRGSLLIIPPEIKNYKQGDMVTQLNIVRAHILGKHPDSTRSDVYDGLNGKPVFGTAAHIDVLNWGIISEIPEERIKKPIFNILKGMAGIVFVTILLFSWGGVVFVRQMAGSFKGISNAFKRVREGDYSKNLSTFSITEFNVLSDGFNHMVDEINMREKNLRESENQYRSLFIHMINGFAYNKILVDENNNPVDFEYISVNEAYEKITGLKKEEIIGKKFTEMVQGIKEFHPELIETYGKVALNGEDAEFTFFLKPLQKWLHIFAYSPQKGYFAAVLHDITEQKLAEDKIKEKQSLNDLLLDSLPHPSMIINRDWVILAANKIALEVGAKVGKPCWESFGQSLSIPEQDKKYIEQHKKVPKCGTHCTFCLADKTLDKQKSFNIDVEIEEKVFDTYWVPIDKERYLHYAIDITGRKETEKKIIESRKLLTKSQEIAHMGHWVMDVDSRKLYWSDEEYSVFGLQPEQIDPNFDKFLEWVHPDDREMLAKKTALALKSDDHPYRYEFRIVRDGVERYIHEEAEVERDSSGKPLRMIGISQDITERKLAERALIESQKKYQTLVETSQDLIWQVDREGRFTYINPAWEKIYEYKIEEILGRPFMDFLTPEQAKKDWKVFKEILDGKDYFGYETTHISKSGKPIHLVFNVLQRKDEDGKIIGTQGTAHDITEIKLSEKALRNSEEKLRNITSSARDAIIMIDSGGKVTYWNPAAEKIFGFSQKEIIDKELHNFIIPEKYRKGISTGLLSSRRKGMAR